jgi:predicted RND superfamily exporter protein
MLLYLDIAYEQAKKEGRLRNLEELRAAIMEGAVKRLRPKFMTVTTTFIGLIPIMWAIGAGADTMKRIAAPMIGGILTSFLLELLVYPAVYQVWRWRFDLRGGRGAEGAGAPGDAAEATALFPRYFNSLQSFSPLRDSLLVLQLKAQGEWPVTRLPCLVIRPARVANIQGRGGTP